MKAVSLLQACQLEDHPYSKVCTLSGQLYDRETLAEVDSDEDESNEDDSSLERPMVSSIISVREVMSIYKQARVRGGERSSLECRWTRG